MKKVLAGIAALISSGQVAWATVPPPPTSVPEISALEGTAAIAALAAIVLLAWERSRRAN